MKFLRDWAPFIGCIVLGVIAGSALWDFIKFPFNNPYDVVGPLTRLEFNPLNNHVRYLIFVCTPALFALALFKFSKTNRFAIAEREIRPNESRWARPLAWIGVVILMLWVTRQAGGLHLRSLGGALDMFHDGESLLPAINYQHGMGIWKGALFIHGALYDPFTALIGWKLFGIDSVGAYRFMFHFFFFLADLTMAYFLFAAYRTFGPSMGKTMSASLVLLLSVSLFYSAETLHYYDRRDAPVFLSLALLLEAYSRKQRSLAALAGALVPFTFFYSIDRGAYLFAGELVSLSLVLLLPKTRRETAPVALFWLLGHLCGWLLFAAFAGLEEFGMFLSNTGWFFRTKDLFDSFVYPPPEFRIWRRHVWIPFLNSVAVLWLLARLFSSYSRKKVAAGEVFFHVVIVSLAVVYYRSALGRTDIPHMMYVSTFAVIAGTFTVWHLLMTRLPLRLVTIVHFLTTGGFALHLLTQVFAFTKLDYSAARQEQREAIRTPNEVFVPADDRAALNWLREIFKDEPCFASLTNSGGFPFLLKKPTCSRIYMPWFASAKPLRLELLADLQKKMPRFIVTESARASSMIDGISMKERIPEVFEWVEANYSFFETREGWTIYRRRNGGPR